jgi:uracil-DNA glycosylase
MNAKERLRAYLEQRRELGESELLLDALDVDDVLRMVGALQGNGAASEGRLAPPHAGAMPSTPISVAVEGAPLPAESSRPATPTPRAPDRGPEDRPTRDERVVPANLDQGNDWRQMMQQLQGTAPPKVPPPAAAPGDVPAGQAAQRKPGTLRVEGAVFPLGLRIERPIVQGPTAGDEWQTLAQVTAAIAACKGCGLVQTATQPVPGVGNPIADVMVVGEAPGEKEDLTGEPFVGPAGELLNKILGAIQLTRESVYICNVLKHRPPGNRNPMPDEVRACAPFLQRQIDLVQPKIIIACGTFAAQSLLGSKLGIGKLRQQLHWYLGIPLVATYHPAALLRNEAWKRPTWEDVKLARRVLDATLRS